MAKKKNKYKEIACAILATNMEARKSIKAFHVACLKEVYGIVVPSIGSWEELLDLIFGKDYNFYSWDRARIWAQTKFPYYNLIRQHKEELKAKYKEFAKKPLEPVTFSELVKECFQEKECAVC